MLLFELKERKNTMLELNNYGKKGLQLKMPFFDNQPKLHKEN